MFKRLIFISFFSLLISNDSIANKIFDYSFQNTKFKNFVFNFQLLKSNDKLTNYHITWMPTDNLFINTNFSNPNSHLSDNKLYYNINLSLLLSSNVYSGFGVSRLKFDNTHNTVKWIDYFINSNLNINNLFNINFGMAYLYNDNASFFKSNISFNKNIYKKINCGIGAEAAQSLSFTKFYFTINYSI